LVFLLALSKGAGNAGKEQEKRKPRTLDFSPPFGPPKRRKAKKENATMATSTHIFNVTTVVFTLYDLYFLDLPFNTVKLLSSMLLPKGMSFLWPGNRLFGTHQESMNLR